MPRTRLLALLALALALPLLLVACGGDDDEGSGEDDAITEAIEMAATQEDPAKCTTYQTQAFNEQTEFNSGEEALADCEESATDGDVAGESVQVSNIEIDGDTATAEVAFTGGGLDGQTLRISLVKEGDQWKLDSLDEFLEFDQQALIAALTARLASTGAPQEVSDCLAEELEAADSEELQAVFLSGEQGGLLALFEPCIGGA